MIAFGCSITEVDVYDRCAAPGFRLASEPDTELLAYGSDGTVFRSYNMLLDRAKAHGGLEALVIVHQDAEIVDPDLIPKVREALRDPEVALVGCAGARGVRSIAWWEGSVTWASFRQRFDELGGGEIPALSWVPERIPPHPETGEVDTIDGLVIGFSPWAIENLRFDESIGGRMHGYDFDICMQARAAGRKVVTADLGVVHHHQLDLLTEGEGWVETHIKLAEKWHQRLPAEEGDWRHRARRAEAELSAVRLDSGASRLIWEGRAEQLERRIVAMERTAGWRVTRPLRWLNALVRSRA